MVFVLVLAAARAATAAPVAQLLTSSSSACKMKQNLEISILPRRTQHSGNGRPKAPASSTAAVTLDALNRRESTIRLT